VVVTCIGQIEAGHALRLVDRTGQPLPARFSGFDHFAA
jgi:thiamine monophosphate kinase